MMRKLLLLFAFLGFTYAAAFAQTGKLAGKLVDKTTREPIAFGTVVVKLNGTQKGHSMTDINGNYSISPLTPGSYTVEAPYVGYNTAVITGVQVTVDKTTNLNVELAPSSTTEIGVVDVIAYREPLIGPEKVGETISQEEIRKMPTREVATMAATTAGVQSSDDGKALSVKGTRTNGTVYYVNGVKQLVEPSLPANAISQMTVLTGGIPAQYGDATGGIINITTSSPSSSIAGGLEVATSAPFDKYDNNLLSFNLTGPLWKKTSADTTNFSENRTILGFFLGGQFQNSNDDNPSAQGVWMMNDATKAELSERPYVNGIDAGQFITFQNMEKSKIRQNVKSMRFSLNSSIDIQPKENMMLTFGGNYSHSDRNLYINSYSLFNPENNPQQIIKNWNAYGRFIHNFNNSASDSSASTIKNAYYQLQFDFSKYDRVIQNEDLKDDLWRYGYIGKFSENLYEDLAFYRVRNNPTDPTDTTTTLYTDVKVNRGIKTGLNFTESGDNPLLAAYSRQVIDERAGIGQPLTSIISTGTSSLLFNRGLINGFSPTSVYSIYAGRGSVYPFYSLLNNDQYRLSALGSAELGKHTIKLGFEFEQRVETFYSLNANNLWNIGRGLLAQDIIGQSTTNYTVREENGQRFIDYAYIPSASQSTFSTRLREQLGIPANQPINIDELTPEQLSIGLFSADELVTPGIVSYQGFSYTGKRNTKKVNFNEYFSDPNRPQDAVRPIYTAAFIEDKFQIEDLTLRAGLRIDRFDANQRVLKDPYSLVELLRAGDVRNMDLRFANGYTIPSNIGDDYAIYVNKNSIDFSEGSAQTFTVTGYRSGDNFFDANGNPTENSVAITQNGIFPLFDPALQGGEGEYIQDRRLSVKAFKDYEPQLSVNPRLSFSFPISEDALFFAHYDILTQRPERNGTLPSDYYFLLGSVGARNQINNPDLKPQKKIDYEVGFEQRLSRSSSLSISAYYSEFRDQISARRYTAAYPQEYTTFGNLDFGVSKGMTLEYDMRRTKNIALGASYTLQFATGTGSSATTGLNTANQGLPNLRTPMPLDFDQRHAFKVNLDFRFADDEGPVLFDKKIFQNAGINLILNAGSGEPYSRQANVTNFITAIGRPIMAGSLNGSRKPANIRAGLRIDKDFTLGTKEGSNSFVKALNVYFRVTNLFNTMNVINVYRYTGSATDDGFIDTYLAEQGDAASQALIDIYSVRLLNGAGSESVGANPTNYSLPRRAEIGATLSF